MKISSKFNWAVAATILLSCTACTKTDRIVKSSFKPNEYQLKHLVVPVRFNVWKASPALLSRALGIAPAMEQFITPCTPATMPTADRMVKVRINDGFDVKVVPRDMISKKVGGGGVRAVPEPTLTPDSTTYDMKLDKTVWDPTDKIIAVKIILKDGQMLFLDDKYSVTTVVAPTLATSSFMCLAPIQYGEDKPDNEDENGPDGKKPDGTPRDKYQVVTFYVDKLQLQTRKFNIRVLVFNNDGHHVLPIILDPAVENNGFN